MCVCVRACVCVCLNIIFKTFAFVFLFVGSAYVSIHLLKRGVLTAVGEMPGNANRR